jgi:large subunit ribosomal protein L4
MVSVIHLKKKKFCRHNNFFWSTDKMDFRLKIDEITLAGDKVGSVEAPESVFGADVRRDIIHRVIRWQQAKSRSGNHKTKGISDISGTTRKPHNQKGSGRARQGSLRSPQFRGGAVIFGPVVRDHSHSLPKKIRRQGLRSALSALLKEGRISCTDSMSATSRKLRDLNLASDGSLLLVGGEVVCQNLRCAISNRANVNILPQCAVNVLDLVRHDRVVLSKDAMVYLDRFLSQERSSL